jgi:RNA polymerase sigma-70 factor (ECF subfamily)
MARRTDDSIVDPEGFERAFTANFRTIHQFLSRRAGSTVADDLAAETFAIAFRRRQSFDPERGALLPWLYGIATNLLRAHWRAEQHTLALEARLMDEPDARYAGVDIDDKLLAAWIAPHLARALSMLPLEQRDVLLLYAWADLSNEEIASALELPSGTVRSRLSRARAKLREYLGEFDFDRWLFADSADSARPDSPRPAQP